MTSCVINPERLKGEPQLPPAGILAVNPSDAVKLQVLAAEHQLKSHFLFHSRLYSSSTFFLAGPAVGAPMAVLCLEKLIALGAKRIILYGWCGSLVSDLRTGDILVPTHGVSEEGTSRHYSASSGSFPDQELRKSIITRLAPVIGSDVKQGPIWTTDAFYRETRAKIEQFGKQGIMAVDMEYSALCTVAAYRQVAFAAAMLVSDELYHPVWRPGYTKKTFKKQSKEMLDQLCSYMATCNT